MNERESLCEFRPCSVCSGRETCQHTGTKRCFGEGHVAAVVSDPHNVDACYDDGEGRWSLVCSCQWEAWGYATEERVRHFHAAHKLDPTADKPVTVTA